MQVRDQILASDADVVALQEMSPAWWLRLRRELKKAYPHARVLRHPKKGGWLAVFSRFALTELGASATIEDWVPSWALAIHTPQGRIQVLNVHLWVPADPEGRPSPLAMWRADELHQKELAALFGYVEDAAPTVVLGDFNELPSGGGRAWLQARGFSDGLTPFDSDTPTWSNENGPLPLQARIDHILLGPGLRGLQGGVNRAGPSDHRAVWTRFTFARPGVVGTGQRR
jgi:endonuclease/exonuclease/phosphatase family metal-dependent hydrolase